MRFKRCHKDECPYPETPRPVYHCSRRIIADEQFYGCIERTVRTRPGNGLEIGSAAACENGYPVLHGRNLQLFDINAARAVCHFRPVFRGMRPLDHAAYDGGLQRMRCEHFDSLFCILRLKGDY